MPVRLIFGQPRYAGGSVRLVFGAGTGVVVPDPLEVTVTVQMDDVSVAALATYDNRNPRRASASASAAHQVAAPSGQQHRVLHGLADRAELPARAPWAHGRPEQGAPITRWDTPARAAGQGAATWVLGAPRSAHLVQVHEQADVLRRQVGLLWGDAAAAKADWALAHEEATRLRTHAVAPWQLAARVDATAAAAFGRGRHIPRSAVAPWQVARPAPAGRTLWVPVDPGGITPHEPSTHLVFACPRWLGGPVHLVFGHVCGVQPPQATVVVPIRSVYMIVNTAALRRVSNNQSLPTYNTSLTIDSDSWTWSFSASMPADALSMIQRVDPAEPVEVELTINGNSYRALIESAVRSRTFKDWTLTVRGRGLGAVLDAPYAPQQVFLNSEARTAQQLMSDALTVNGASIGWDLDWGIEDWLVPAQAWSHQGSMMSAVNAIAAAAGAYIQPHPTSQILRVLPKYPSAPWDWATVTPDYQLPADVMSVEGIEWVDRANYNRVFVSGVQHGVIGQVTRAGTAGDLVAPMVTDQLITHVDAARQRGLAELAKGGRWAEMSLKLPVLTETGVIHPGKFVRYNDGALDRLGIVRRLSVADDGNDIWQTIGVESYVA